MSTRIQPCERASAERDRHGLSAPHPSGVDLNHEDARCTRLLGRKPAGAVLEQGIREGWS